MVSLQDITLLVTDGKHGDCQSAENSGYYFISCKDVKDGWIEYSGARQITETDFLDAHRRTQLEPDDILITNSGTIGRIALVHDTPLTYQTTFQKSVAIIKPNKYKVFPKWLYYYLIANKNALIRWAGGTAQKNLLLRDLRAFPVKYAPLPSQRKIAAVLSNYDNLIENNMKRIKILEEFAQSLYNEWFVHFRYPGHEKTEIIETDYGPKPKGWSFSNLSSIVDNIKVKEKAGKHLHSLAYIPLSCIESKSLFINTTRPGKAAKTSLIRFRKYDIIFGAMRAYLHKVVVAPRDGITRTTCFVLRPKKSIYYPYSVMTLYQNATIEFANKRSTGSTIPYAIWEEGLSEMPILIPPHNVLQYFNSLIMPIIKEITLIHPKNIFLRKMRDLLLPKLFSGEIDIDKMDINATSD